MCAYQVTLAVGNARRHDTGERIRVDVLAGTKLDAAVIAETSTNQNLSDTEYAYAKGVRCVKQPAAVALAA